MGILGNAISDILDQGINFGFNQLGGFLQRGRDGDTLEKQVAAA